MNDSVNDQYTQEIVVDEEFDPSDLGIDSTAQLPIDMETEQSNKPSSGTSYSEKLNFKDRINTNIKLSEEKTESLDVMDVEDLTNV